MKKIKIFPLILIICLALCALAPSAYAIDDPQLGAQAVYLADMNTDEVLYEKNADEQRSPASLTKIMTGLLAIEAVESGQCSMDDIVTAGADAWYGMAEDSSNSNIQPGEMMTYRDLVYCAVVHSANEACNILGEAVSGTVGSFVARMNERAQELGCEHTHFVNASGLHDPQHYTTAWDLYLITCEAMKHEKFMEICNTKSHTVPATNLTDKPRELHTTNFLISNWRARGYVYRDAQGIKTGSTPEAGYCLISSALRGSRRMISVVLGAERVTLEDGVTIQTRSFSETSRMFDWGFGNFSRQDILSADEPIREVPVALSSETNYVVVHGADSLSCLLPDNVTPEMLERTVTLTNETVEAPIAAGDVLGTLTLSYDGTVYGETELLALNDVSASWFLTAQRDVIAFLSQTWVKLALLALALLITALVVYVVVFSRRRRYGRRRGSASSGYRGRRRRF